MDRDIINNIMLDLETMGNGSNAAIIAMGAVRFDDENILDKFYTTVTLESSVNAGLEIDAQTVMWWMQQSDEARAQFAESKTRLSVALANFSAWVGGYAVVWGNGSDFDNAILGNAFKKSGLRIPWEYYNNRCYRTVKRMRPEIDFERVGTYHNAVDDAESQARHLIKILAAIGGGNPAEGEEHATVLDVD